MLVASPRRDTVAEAHYFADRLAEAGISVQGLIVNRMHPTFGDAGLPEAVRERARTLAGTDIGGLYQNLADFQLVAADEETHLAGLAATVVTGAGGPRPVPRQRRPRPRGLAQIASDHLFDRLTERADAGGRWSEPSSAATASSTVSVTGTMRSNPVVCSRRVRVGRLHATATSPPASRARRMPPMSAPRPAESMNGTDDRSMSR